MARGGKEEEEKDRKRGEEVVLWLEEHMCVGIVEGSQKN